MISCGIPSWGDVIKKITFSADEGLIEAARKRASAEQTTLNAQFRLWLKAYGGRELQADRASTVMRELQGRLRVGRRLTRGEMNER